VCEEHVAELSRQLVEAQQAFSFFIIIFFLWEKMEHVAELSRHLVEAQQALLI
jgi:hypothetical protein